MVMSEGRFVNEKGPLGQNHLHFVIICTFFQFNDNLT